MNDELNFFLSLLEPGDKVAVYEGGYDENFLSHVASVTGKYIQVDRYPSLRFDRLSGKQVPNKKGGHVYRHLFSVEVFHLERAQADYKDKLFSLINDATITSSEKFNKCYEALEQILND